MTAYRVTYINESPISELKSLGEILYDSPVMRMIWIKTDTNIETLQQIKNISLVEIDIKPERIRAYYR